MRYALRNQDKIAANFSPNGEKILARIKTSLDKELAEIADMESLWIKIDPHATPFPVLTIDDTGHTCGLISFYILGQKYDVVRLAFKEFIG